MQRTKKFENCHITNADILGGTPNYVKDRWLLGNNPQN